MRKWYTLLAIGIVLALGPIWGLVGTVIGMMRAFSDLSESAPDAGALSDSISMVLYAKVAGYVVWPVGVALIVVASLKLRGIKKGTA